MATNLSKVPAIATDASTFNLEARTNSLIAFLVHTRLDFAPQHHFPAVNLTHWCTEFHRPPVNVNTLSESPAYVIRSRGGTVRFASHEGFLGRIHMWSIHSCGLKIRSRPANRGTCPPKEWAGLNFTADCVRGHLPSRVS